jgi:hypothetical protein
MMQRILEEGTYAFSSRWIPGELKARGWTCSEAVELAAWRDTLPSILPLESLVTKFNYRYELAISWFSTKLLATIELFGLFPMKHS